MNTRYAISDIHGNYKTFLNALDRIQLSPSDELYILGDYIDRGPNSRAVINHILQLQAGGYNINCIRGNHEQYMLNAFNSDDSDKHFFWLRAGGGPTLDSYHKAANELFPDFDKHLQWAAQLPFYLDIGDYYLVHAGINFRALEPLKDLESLIQIRHWHEDINDQWLGKKHIVHGHTPMKRKYIEAQLSDSHPYPAFDIDAGCFYHKHGFGHLCVMNLDDRAFHFLPNADMNLRELRKKHAMR